MRTLRDINQHILDMEKSTWVDADGKERKFDPATWKDDLKDIVEQKASLKTKTYYNPNGKPKEWLWWCRWNPPVNIAFQTAKVTLPAKPVTVDRDPYWPEGFEPNTEGYYIHGDLVLMKRPYVDHLKDEIAKVKRGKGGAKALMEEFRELTAREGVGLKGNEAEQIGSDI